MLKRKGWARAFAMIEIIAIPIFILSVAILIPIAFRPFYYWQIDPLGIPASSGFSKEEILVAFNDVLDFIWFHAPFKMGNLKYSSEGKAHFEDCVFLFHLDLWLCVITAVILLTLFILKKTRVIKIADFFRFPPSFYGASVLLLFVIAVLIYGLIDFKGLFATFHHVLFPGKENWIFDPDVDQFILILPEQFMVNAGILIGSVSGAMTFGCLGYGIVKKAKSKNRRTIDEN